MSRMPVKKSYSDHGDACAASHAMELVGDHWNYPILRELTLAPKRFGELLASIRGVTPAVLTARLRALETSGLVRRTTLPAPARVQAYELTEWAHDLEPIMQSLARWAMRSPQLPDGGLTPDAAAQSMRTMAPSRAMSPPITLDLHLHDARLPDDAGYDYTVRWGKRIEIIRGSSARPQARVSADSTSWMGVLYDGAALSDVGITVEGDEAAVDRLVAGFEGALEAHRAS